MNSPAHLAMMNASTPETRVLAPGPTPRSFLTSTGQVVTAPEGWACLAPGDAGLTRRVKAAGPTWLVEERRGRKRFSRGLWAPAALIEAARVALQRPPRERLAPDGLDVTVHAASTCYDST